MKLPKQLEAEVLRLPEEQRAGARTNARKNLAKLRKGESLQFQMKVNFKDILNVTEDHPVVVQARQVCEDAMHRSAIVYTAIPHAPEGFLTGPTMDTVDPLNIHYTYGFKFYLKRPASWR